MLGKRSLLEKKTSLLVKKLNNMDKPKFKIGQTVYCDTSSFDQSTRAHSDEAVIEDYERSWKQAKITRIFHAECQEIMPDGALNNENELPDDLPYTSHDEYLYELDRAIEWADNSDYGDHSTVFREYCLLSLDELKEKVEKIKQEDELKAKKDELNTRILLLERQMFNLEETKKLCPQLSTDIDKTIMSMKIEISNLTTDLRDLKF